MDLFIIILIILLFYHVMGSCSCRVEGLSKPTFPVQNARTKAESDLCSDKFDELKGCWVNEGGNKDNPPPDFLCWYNSMDNKYNGHSNDVSMCEKAQCKVDINDYVDMCVYPK